MIEAVNKTCTRALIVNEDLVCLCEDIADYINGKDELWPIHKSEIIHTIESYSPKHTRAINGTNTTYNWLNHLNESWHNYYNPDYINCGPDIEAVVPSSHLNKIKDLTSNMNYTPEEPGKGIISAIMNIFGFEEDGEEEPEDPEEKGIGGFFRRLFGFFR